ncbi:MAG TPA: hypothetical protein VLG40_00450 [Candidatus Saccharimonas sp.]|nr:hypothetical protein [Candidatus Saccharimonas sp.]
MRSPLELPRFTMTDVRWPVDRFTSQDEHKLNLAVAASAAQQDPLAELFCDFCDTSATLAAAAAWLADKVKFNTAKLRPGDKNDAFVERLQADGPVAAWAKIIADLASDAVKAQYSIGIDDNNSHEIFTLLFTPLIRHNIVWRPKKLDPDYWSIFVKAVVMRAWLITFSPTPEPEYNEYAQRVNGLVLQLSNTYPATGELQNGRYYLRQASEGGSIPQWQANINYAAHKLATTMR